MTGSGDAITKSELKYRRLFEAAQDGILLLSYPEGRVEDANPFILNLIGYSLEDLLGKRLWELGFVADKSVAEAAFRDLITNNYVRYENIDLKAKNGRKRTWNRAKFPSDFVRFEVEAVFRESPALAQQLQFHL